MSLFEKLKSELDRRKIELHKFQNFADDLVGSGLPEYDQQAIKDILTIKKLQVFTLEDENRYNDPKQIPHMLSDADALANEELSILGRWKKREIDQLLTLT